MDPQRLLLLSILLWAHTEAEVVQSVGDCKEFFLDGRPPQIPGVLENGQIQDQDRYKAICQTYENQRRFFTLYDTTNKIPVFSAYIFNGSITGRQKRGWMIEPQLEKNMEKPSNKDKKYQASEKDYNNQLGYDKAHLYPNSYGSSYTDKNSTFTLTNAVPQARSFNGGSWSKMESCISCVITKFCLDSKKNIKGFLVTGADPGNNLLNNKVNIPSVMWSAFCCYSSRENKWLASAHWGDNVPDVPTNKYMETKTLNELYSSRGTDFKLFWGYQCPSDATVTKFYPELNEDEKCKCATTATTTAAPTTASNLTTTQEPTSTTAATTTIVSKRVFDTIVKFVLSFSAIPVSTVCIFCACLPRHARWRLCCCHKMLRLCLRSGLRRNLQRRDRVITARQSPLPPHLTPPIGPDPVLELEDDIVQLECQVPVYTQ